jgi:transposase
LCDRRRRRASFGSGSIESTIKQIKQIDRRTQLSGAQWKSENIPIVDSQSVQIGSTPSSPQAVGCDGGKKVKGRKRHILVDTWGLLMVVVVRAANLAEREGAKLILAKSQTNYPRLFKVLADAGYDGAPLLQWVMDTYHWIWDKTNRTDRAVGFIPLPQRWVVVGEACRRHTYFWLV